MYTRSGCTDAEIGQRATGKGGCGERRHASTSPAHPTQQTKTKNIKPQTIRLRQGNGGQANPERNTTMNKTTIKTIKQFLAVALAATFSGCYVGKATFQGEDMRMYPFFSTTAATTAATD